MGDLLFKLPQAPTPLLSHWRQPFAHIKGNKIKADGDSPIKWARVGSELPAAGGDRVTLLSNSLISLLVAYS